MFVCFISPQRHRTLSETKDANDGYATHAAFVAQGKRISVSHTVPPYYKPNSTFCHYPGEVILACFGVNLLPSSAPATMEAAKGTKL